MQDIALFDLDETLVHGDTATAWCQFAFRQRLVTQPDFIEINDTFYQDYINECLDILKYIQHNLRTIKGQLPAQTRPYIDAFITEYVEPRFYQEGIERVKKHLDHGDIVILISASSEHIVRPISEKLGMHDGIGCTPEIKDGRYTGRIAGTPSFKDGKVTRFKEWLQQHNQNPSKTWFYSDSPNDIPLLKYVNHPIAVNPAPRLVSFAQDNGWPVEYWNPPN